MIGRWSQSKPEEEGEDPKSFDDFELKLGDVLRGERATMGKSLLDVQRELKIKAAYIAAIENADPSAFDTPGFIAGFVRSYARYLNVDGDWAFDKFCEESGFEPVHGMAAQALPLRNGGVETRRDVGSDPLAAPVVPFTPEQSRFLETVEPRAIGSSLVLIALMCGLGYGAYAVVQEVQRVDVAPVEQAPSAIVQLDPLAAPSTVNEQVAAVGPAPTDALDRLYRPPALDLPVMVARDAPIATLNPDRQGIFASAPRDSLPSVDGVDAVQVVEGPAPEVVLFAVDSTWVRVQAPDKSVLFEKILEKGEEYAIPVTEETPILRAGNSGSLYFKVNGSIVGPAGQGTAPVQNVVLASTDLSAAYPTVTPEQDQRVFDVLKELNAPALLPASEGVVEAPASPELLPAPEGAVTLVAVNDTWVRVRDSDGAVVFQGIITKGSVQLLPEGQIGTLRAGNSGSLYFQIGDQIYGPAGAGTSTARNVDISPTGVQSTYSPVAPEVFATLR